MKIILLTIMMVGLCSCTKDAPLGEERGRDARTFNVSAYCPCERCCGDWADGFFADGTKAVGRAVAAPKSFKFGTMIDIPGYGKVPVRDRGGAIQGDKLDVFFPTHQEALNWGRQYLECEVIE